MLGDVTLAIINIYDRQELKSSFRLQYINSIVIDHYDYNFDSMLKKGNKTIFEGIQEFEKNSDTTVFHLRSLETLNKNSITSSLMFYTANVVSSTRQVHFQRYIEINAELLRMLRKEYHIN